MMKKIINILLHLKLFSDTDNFRLFFFLISSVILSYTSKNIFAQDDSKPLAKVGNQVITIDEFRNRYEFMPHLNYSSDNKETLRKEFLYSLIAEKLWALEALEKRIDTLDIVKNSLKTLEKLLVKDELFRSEVESKIKITSEEISKGLLRVGRTLYLKILSSEDSSEIFDLYIQLRNSGNFDSLLSVRPENISLQNPIVIKVGTLADEAAEDLVFNLKSGEISEPFKSNNKWYIFNLVNEEIDSSLINDNETAKNKTISILSEKKRRKIAGNFLDKLLGGRTISANNELFNDFADVLVSVVQERIGKQKSEVSDKIELTPDDLIKTLKLLNRDKLKSLFVEFDSVKISLEDFIYYLMYQKVYLPSSSTNKIKLVLNRAVKQFIEDEIITQEGYARGLDKLSSVQKDIEIWKNYYLAELMYQSFSDSVAVSDSEVESYITEKINDSSNQTLINIIEIFTPNLNDMLSIIEELNNGSDFSELAKKYNKREYTKKSNGEWGFFQANSAGQIGKIGAEMEVGQIYGPIKVEGGYSIFKLIDKKIISDSLITRNEEPKEYVKIKLSLNKLTKLINENTAKLAKKYKISIDETLLNEIELSELNMFTYRLIGFGGKIAAMPITIPMFEWYYLINNQNEIP